MASIVKRGNSVAVVYHYKDELGQPQQKWETVHPDDAEARKKEIELEMLKKEFISPRSLTVKDYLYQWVDVYAPDYWSYNTYTSNLSVINNHIIPYIGEMQIQEVKSIHIENLYNTLRKVRVKGPKSYNKPEGEIPFLSSTTIRQVHGILVPAFKKAVEWEIIKKSPILCEAPKKNKVETTIWTPEMLFNALKEMEAPKYHLLHLAVHTAFIATTRNGETVGLTWDNIEFTSDRIIIKKTLQRIKKKALEELPKDNLYFVFPDKNPDSTSILILKKPKTDSSNRFLYMTAPLKQELLERRKQVQLQKELYGEHYHDYNLVFCLDNGDPVEPKLLEKWFKKWQKAQLGSYPEIVFHGIRHSSITCKLYLSEGDYKAVQGDSGHASALMVTEQYAHMQDPRRYNLARKMEEAFYNNVQSMDNDKLKIVMQILDALNADQSTIERIMDILS